MQTQYQVQAHTTHAFLWDTLYDPYCSLLSSVNIYKHSQVFSCVMLHKKDHDINDTLNTPKIILFKSLPPKNTIPAKSYITSLP